MSYKIDRNWSDRFIPEIRRIVGPFLLEPSSMEVDRQQAADLVVMMAKNLTIACRVRRHRYDDRYPWEFTIRSHRDNGSRTELEKITDGWADWMFYGHHDGTPRYGLSRWMLLDLDSWRASMIRHRMLIRPENKSNGDGTHFVVFDVRKFPFNEGCKPLVIGSSHSIPIGRVA